MISFTCDYNEGAHPEILRRLAETNMQQVAGYGDDPFTASAREKIRLAAACPDADVFFLVGGTQTNATVISSLLRSYEGVLAADTGHIAVHEAGAVELSGNKVLTLPAHDGKITAGDLQRFLDTFFGDDTRDHMVQPGMVYISLPTELGTVYSRAELQTISDTCRRHKLPLFVDGARLAYALAANECDIDLPTLASLCDVFYIGGTKAGTLCGEAVVFPRHNAPRHFFTHVKQHGALLAKGRLLGIQFDTLFTDGLYLRLGQHGVGMATRMKRIFAKHGIAMNIPSPTNQQFPVLAPKHQRALEGKVLYETWGVLPDGSRVTRFATSWATTAEQLHQLDAILTSIS